LEEAKEEKKSEGGLKG